MTNRSFEEIMRAAGVAAAKVKRGFVGNCPLFCRWRLLVLTHVFLAEQSTTVRI